MNAIQILQHFYDRCDWLDRQVSVDRIIFGDPEKPLQSALVTWISSLAACQEAARRGVDLLITHEPTFWQHTNERVDLADATAVAKAKVLEQAGLTVVRIHDAWDTFPAIGIPYAWAKFLGIDTTPVAFGGAGYQHRYDIATLPAGEFAHRVAAQTALLGEPVVQFAGDPEKMVSHIGIGTGCACNTWEFERMGCDLFVVCDDGTSYWHSVQHAVDGGFPVVRVNHGTAEEPGMITLAHYLQTTFPELRVAHLPYPGSYTPVSRTAAMV